MSYKSSIFNYSQPSTSKLHLAEERKKLHLLSMFNQKSKRQINFKHNAQPIVLSSSCISLISKVSLNNAGRKKKNIRKSLKLSCSQKFMNFLLTFLLWMLFILANGASAMKGDILEALMIESLRNNLVQACDGEKITLHCPRNTQIIIQNVFYGRLVPSAELCPANSAIATNNGVGAVNSLQNQFDDESLVDIDNVKTTTFKNLLINKLTKNETAVLKKLTKRSHNKYYGAPSNFEDTSCDVSEAHMKIDGLCKGKRKCRIVVKPNFFGDRDPCPSTSKYLQISYKCKPTSFEDQNFCEGTTMQLSCKANKRLSIYSAQYGRTVNGQAMHCSTNFDKPVNKDDIIYLTENISLVNDEVFSEAALKGSLETMKELEEVFISNKITSTTESRIDEYLLQSDDQLSDKLHEQQNQFNRELSKNLNNKAADYNNLESYDNKDIEEHYEDYENEDTFLHKKLGENNKVSSEFDEKKGKQQRQINSESVKAADATTSASILDVSGLGFAEDFSSFVKYLKESKEESFLYFFLFASIAVIAVLLICICYQCRSFKHKDVDKRFSTSLSSKNLLNSNNILIQTKKKGKFFRQNYRQNHQTVCVAPNSSGVFQNKAGLRSCGSSSSSSAGSTGSARSSGCGIGRPQLLNKMVETQTNGGMGISPSEISSLLGGSAQTTPLYLESERNPLTNNKDTGTYTAYWDYSDGNYAPLSISDNFQAPPLNSRTNGFLNSGWKTTEMERIGYSGNYNGSRSFAGSNKGLSSVLKTSNNRQCALTDESAEQNYYARCTSQSTLSRIPLSLHYYS